MTGGERVRLTPKAAAARMRFRRKQVNSGKTARCGVNWYERVGTIRSCRGPRLILANANAQVIWDGTTSPETIPTQALCTA
jgi:hypothetical protein